MTERCGYKGCGHTVTIPGACGDRNCPRNAERRLAISSAIGRSRAAPAKPADGADDDVFGLRPGRVDLLWHAPDGSYSRRHQGPYRYDAFIPAELAEIDLTIAASLRRSRGCGAGGHRPEPGRGSEPRSRRRTPPAVGERRLIRIENLRVSHRRVAEALVDPQHAPASAREVANNVAAMAKAISSADKSLDRETIRSIHHALLVGTRDEEYAGVERTVQNWIGGQSPRDAFYVPPPPEMVGALLDDLVEFANRDDVPAVAQAAIVHAEFEGIHPFVDGNGRTGRCLVHAVLRRRGVAPTLVPPISAVLLTDRDGYYSVLADFQQRGNPIPLLYTFAGATATASRHAAGITVALRERQVEWFKAAGHPRSGSIARKLIESLPAQPVLTAEIVAETHGVDPNVARRGSRRSRTPP